MKTILAILVLLFSIHTSGVGNKINGDISPIFDLSPDGENIAIAISEGESSFLYQYSLRDKSIVQLTDAKHEYHVRPVYSPKGDKIMFLSKSLENQQSDVCLLDLVSKTITKITKGETYVTEAAFSPLGDKIIYCGAGYLGNYSPVARKAPHDLDLFSINTDGTGFKKLTNLSAYELSSISLTPTGDSVLCELTKKEFAGIYLMSLTDSTAKKKIEAINNPRPEIGSSFYGSPVFSLDYKKISFIAPYQLYTLNLGDKKCELIWDNTKDEIMLMPIHSRFLKSGDKIIFSVLKIEHRQYTTSAELYMVDLSTKELKKIEI